MSTLTESDLSDLAERYADIPWAVYAQGLDRVLTHEIPDVPEGSPGNRPLDRVGAIALAEQLEEDAKAVSVLDGVTVELTTYVLHHGIVWIPR